MAKRGNLILLTVSIILALVVTLVIIHQLPKQTVGVAAAPVATKPVVVVLKDVPSGTVINSTEVQVKQMPSSAVESGAVTDPSSVVGQYAATQLIAGQQVIQGMYETAAQANIAYSIPKGDRAFTIPDSVTSGVDYLLLPGDTVDMLEYGAPGGTILISNLQVLYVDHVQPAAGSDSLPASTSGGDTLTVAVTPQQALQLAKLVAALSTSTGNNGKTGVLHVLLHSTQK